MHMLLWQKKVFPLQGAEREDHTVNKMAAWVHCPGAVSTDQGAVQNLGKIYTHGDVFE